MASGYYDALGTFVALDAAVAKDAKPFQPGDFVMHVDSGKTGVVVSSTSSTTLVEFRDGSRKSAPTREFKG